VPPGLEVPTTSPPAHRRSGPARSCWDRAVARLMTWSQYRETIGDRSGLSAGLADRYPVERALYLGSYVDLSPSTAFRSVTYVDTDALAARSFADTDLVRTEPAGRTRPGAGAAVRFVAADHRHPWTCPTTAWTCSSPSSPDPCGRAHAATCVTVADCSRTPVTAMRPSLHWTGRCGSLPSSITGAGAAACRPTGSTTTSSRATEDGRCRPDPLHGARCRLQRERSPTCSNAPDPTTGPGRRADAVRRGRGTSSHRKPRGRPRRVPTRPGGFRQRAGNLGAIRAGARAQEGRRRRRGTRRSRR
jgi:hypothetical protein